ncbi:uncharacterized protein LOC144479935 [Mustelus asterias]
MKALAVTLMFLAVTGTWGAAIPLDESKPNTSVRWQQIYWDLSMIGSDLASVGIGALVKTEIGKSIVANLSIIEGPFNELIRNSMKQMSSLSKEFTWKGHPLTQHFINKTSLIQEKLVDAGDQLQEAIGNETVTAIHQRLKIVQKELHRRNLNETQIAHQLDQIYHDATHELESYNITSSINLSQHIQDVKDYLTNAIQAVKDGLKILANLNAKPTAAP